MPSRRAILAGVAGTVGAGLAADRIHLGDLDPWTPAPDTWPLPRRDLRNVAAAPTTAAPADPAVDWTVDLPPDVPWRGAGLLADRERVYAGTDGIVALDRTDGTEAWRITARGPRLARHDDRLFAATRPRYEGRDIATPGQLLACDPATGAVAWRRDLPGESGGLAVVNGAVVAARSTDVVAHETGSGIRRWRGSELASRTQPLVHEGSLYLYEGTLTRFRPRDVLAVPLRGPPEPAWSRPFGHEVPPVGIGSSVLVGATRGPPAEADRAALAAFHAADGDRQWGAVMSEEALVAVGPMTGDPGRGRAYVPVYRQSEATPEAGPHEAAVVAFEVADGSRNWRRRVPGYAWTTALAGDTVLVGTAAAEDRREPAGSVRGLAADDGTERWRVSVDAGVVALAPVDGTVFVLTEMGTVVALR